MLAPAQVRLPHIDQSSDGLKALPGQIREQILKERQEVVHTQREKVKVWADGQVKLIGVLDGSEASQLELGTRRNGSPEFELGIPRNGLPKLSYSLLFSLPQYSTGEQGEQGFVPK